MQGREDPGPSLPRGGAVLVKCHYVGVDVGAKELVVSIERNGSPRERDRLHERRRRPPEADPVGDEEGSHGSGRAGVDRGLRPGPGLRAPPREARGSHGGEPAGDRRLRQGFASTVEDRRSRCGDDSRVRHADAVRSLDPARPLDPGATGPLTADRGDEQDA